MMCGVIYMTRERLMQAARNLPWQGVARVVWVGIACASLTCVLVAVPLKFQELMTAAPGATAATGQLSVGDIASLSKLGLTQWGYAVWSVGWSTIFAVVAFCLGIFIFVRRGRHFGAYTLSVAFVTIGVIATVLASPLYSVGPVWANVLRAVQAMGLITTIVGMLIFPDGQFRPTWTRGLSLVWTTYVVTAVFVPVMRLSPSIIIESNRQVILFGWTLLWLVLVVGIQAYRYRLFTKPIERLQVRWVILGWVVVVALTVVVTAATLWLVFTGQPSAVILIARLVAGTLIILACIFLMGCYAIAILRYQLFNIGVVVNRALVYGAATVSILLIYAAIVSGFGALLNTQGNPVIAFAAAAIIALLFYPVRLRVQRGVNRLMYGQRDEPYAVLARFGRQLEATPTLDALLPTIVSTIEDTLKLPLVKIELSSEAQSEKGYTRFPLRHQGERIGALIVAPREGEAELSATDRRLLEDLARQAEVAIHAASVTADLQRARERLVMAREEERRRIRNDLHDGLAPTLSALQLQLGAMRNLIRQNPDRAEASANELGADLRNATAEVRRLVYNLRPPALDDLGLIGAIRSHAQKMSEPDSLSVIVQAPDLPRLPAAVEVAAFRIAHEALTNVLRHAEARQCVITLIPCEDCLILEIRDDGRGISAEAQAGVGLRSIRERAAELGGDCTISSPTGGGTRIYVRLPLKVTTWTS